MSTEGDVGRTVRACRYCPMCHHADLTVTLERRETYSARGRALIRFGVEQGMTEWDADVADVMYRFFADGLCRHVCAGHIDHDEMVLDARHRLFAAGVSPPAVAQVRTNIQTAGNPWGEKEPDLLALTGARLKGEVFVYCGPTARIHRRSTIRSMVKIFERIEVPFCVSPEEGDPGVLLYQLGDCEGGMAAAAALFYRISKSGAQIVVTPDADAYLALKVGFGGMPPLAGVTVLHASEFLAQHLGKLRLHEAESRNVAYHDPCVLARFAPCIAPPRAILRSACHQTPLEIGLWSGPSASCSGECGGVPFTFPHLSNLAAVKRLEQARQVGADIVVAGSPASAMALEQAGGVPVQELCEFIGNSLA